MKPLSLPYLLIGCIIIFCCNYARAQNPTLQISKNPTTCHGSEGSITFGGLLPNTSYQVRYLENGVQKGPVTLVTDATGQISLPNLTQGAYRNFTFTNSGTTLSYVGGAVLSDPILDPPTFNFSSIIICIGDPAPTLPTTSNNGYSGSWSPAVIDPTHDGIYTFTPNISCADPVDITVTVTPKKPVTFPFGTGLVICGSGPVPVLTNTSIEGITGSWSPAVVNPTRSGTYVFTPTVPPPGCLTGTTFSLTLNPIITPVFSFGTSNSICTGGSVPTLPGQSQNGITGNWTPAVVDPNKSGTYIFTPDPGQCSIPVAYALTVKPIIPPVFSNFPNSAATICTGDPAPVLPAASDIGQTGTWTPAVVSNTKSGTYVFTSTSDPCAPQTTVTITVNPILTPNFSFGPSQSVCINVNPPVLPGLSNNSVTGTWSPAVIDNQNTGTYTFTPATGQCAVSTTLNYQVNPIPAIINIRKEDTVYDGDVLPFYDFPVNIPVTGINWTNNNPAIGLQASGAGTVPSFTATNMTNGPITGVVNATPYVNGCMGATQSYKITVLPRFKDIYVPNVFSPNGYGEKKNEVFRVFGNYIATLELHIFNQWGQKMITITDPNQSWDGTFKGSPQPVGVYVYVLKATTTDGRKLSMKGSITLVR
jgi:gliding motility-associated-like protein